MARRKALDLEEVLGQNEAELEVIAEVEAPESENYIPTVDEAASTEQITAVASPVSAVDSVIKAEIETRTRKPRKPRADAGQRRKRRVEDDKPNPVEEMEKAEIEALAETVSKMGVIVLAGLADSYAEKQGDAKWRFNDNDRLNFATAIRYVAKKNASMIAENPELYLFGVAILGYTAPRLGASGLPLNGAQTSGYSIYEHPSANEVVKDK